MPRISPKPSWPEVIFWERRQYAIDVPYSPDQVAERIQAACASESLDVLQPDVGPDPLTGIVTTNWFRVHWLRGSVRRNQLEVEGVLYRTDAGTRVSWRVRRIRTPSAQRLTALLLPVYIVAPIIIMIVFVAALLSRDPPAIAVAMLVLVVPLLQWRARRAAVHRACSELEAIITGPMPSPVRYRPRVPSRRVP